MATQPVLQGTTLPWPKNPGGYVERNGQRAVSLETAGANLVFQRITTSVKREFALSWVLVDNSDKNAIDDAYAELLSAPTSSNFTSPAGATYTVTPPPGNPPLEWEYIEMPAGERWSTTMRLREISS